VEDATLAAIRGHLDERRREQERGADIDRDRARYVREVLRVERTDRLKDAGVVYQQRGRGSAQELAQRVSRKPRGERGGVAEIESHLAQCRAKSPRKIRVPLSGDAEDAYAAREQLLRDGGAESTRVSGDDRHRGLCWHWWTERYG
jgi:hypothetical protein